MDGRQEPNAQPDQKQDSNDEEIIDLTQIVATGDDDEIIELTEILEQPDPTAAAADAPEAPIVPHADVADLALEDEIVELTDIAGHESEAAEDTDWDDLDSALEESFGDLSRLDDDSASDFVVIEAPADILDEEESSPTIADASDAALAPAENTTGKLDEKDEEAIDLLDVDEPEPATVEGIELDEFDSALEDAFGDLGDFDTEDGMDLVAIDTPQEALELGEAEDGIVLPEVDAGITSGDELTAAEAEEISDLSEAAATPETDTAQEPAENTAQQHAEAEPTDEDEGIIDLLEVAATPETDTAQAPTESTVQEHAEAVPTDEDEEIIDLLDIAAIPETDTAQTPAESTAQQPSGTEATDENEEVIDLLDVATPESAMNLAAQNMVSPEETAETAGPDDNFMALDLDDAAVETIAPPAADIDEQEAAMDIAAPSAQALVISAATEPEHAAEPSAPSDSGPISLTESQLEAALEKVIEKIYSQKIEQLLIQAIEKTVKQEIDKIKSALLENGEDSSDSA
jgi:hypothetical protein